MRSADFPSNERARLAALHGHAILDTEKDELFEALTSLASTICRTPIAVVSLVDTERQWFKSILGLPDVTETPREVAFCAHAILQPGIFEVPDARNDDRFHDNPLVTGAPGIRFYAGVPIIDDAGHALGTVCVIDHVPRVLSQEQAAALRHIGNLAQALISQRDKARELALKEAESSALHSAVPIGIYRTDLDGLCTFTNEGWQEITGLDLEASLGYGWISAVHPEDLASVRENWQTAIDSGVKFEMEFRCRRPDGTTRWVLSVARRVEGLQNSKGCIVGIQKDITDRKNTQLMLRRSLAEKSCLLEEIHHRVKNNLQVIQSMLDMQEGRLQDRAAINALRDAKNRVRSISLIHAALYRSSDLMHVDLGATLRDLSAPLAQLHNGDTGAIEFLFDTETVLLTLERAIPCGLIANELITNSVKHGFRGRAAGTIAVSVRNESPTRIRMTVRDDGVGFVDADQAFRGETLGLKLVKLLAEDLEGELAFDTVGGASVSVSFPVSNAAKIATAA